MATPLIEDEGGSAVDSGGSAQVFQTDGGGGSQSADGPSITISYGDGSTATFDAEDLQLYIAAIQTFLLLYVAYKEVSR